MAGQSFLTPPLGGWNFSRLCGSDENFLWSTKYHDIGLCFEQLCLDIPILTILACFSAYYFGLQDGFVVRESTQIIAISIRSFLSFLMGFLPLVQIYIYLYKCEEFIPQIAYLLSAVQGISWSCHCLYNLSLRKKLGLSPRGPTTMCVIWSLTFVLQIISLRTHYLIDRETKQSSYSNNLAYGISVCYTILQMLYGLTFLPRESDLTYRVYRELVGQPTEVQRLLSNDYVRFVEEGDPYYLGVAMEHSSWISKILFLWVSPLMEKGVNHILQSSEDLYDLPDNLHCGTVCDGLNKEMQIERAKFVNKEENREAPEIPSNSHTSLVNDIGRVEIVERKKDGFILFKALHRRFWLEFYSVGMLKLIADISGFAGPMLLNKLITFIEDRNEDVSQGYIYAAGLMATTMISALCDCHFNFLMSLVGLRMRGGLVATIYRKTVSVNVASLQSEFSVGEILNFMSTDTDRIVNSCPSFHAVWSIPFQLGVTLYLLYSQVGLAFLAGLIFSIILVPINKFIANKIGQLSTKLMKKKDERVKLITEVLRGIRAVKLYVWEEYFMRQINKLRNQELKYLKGRKYLDALCVYFWATTPVIISILTFATYVLMGKELTAATVFTSIALLNMLIAPLNAFPWVLNGITEAWVSIKRIQRLLQLPDQDLNTYYYPFSETNLDISITHADFTWGKELTEEEKLKLHGGEERKESLPIEKRSKSKKDSNGKNSKRSSVVQNISFEEVNNEGEDYQDKFILRNINLKVKKGEFLGIIGTVGSGKSSLLSAILAEVAMISGQISISQIESGFAFVTQQPWLQRGTIRENIIFGSPFDETKYVSTLFSCGLSEDMTILPAGDQTGVGEGGTTLSGGQKARVALARAVYQDKSIYLLDDILSAVDPNVAKHIFQHCIMGVLKGKTRILCTHLVQYLFYADRIVLMDKGKIKKEGKPTDVLNEIDDNLVIDIELGDSNPSSYANSILSSIENTTLETGDKHSVLGEEFSEKGNVEFKVYFSYWKAIGHLLSLTILLSIIMMQTSKNMTDWWLAHWVTSSEANGNHSNTSHAIKSNDREVFLQAVDNQNGPHWDDKNFVKIFKVAVGLQDGSINSYLQIYVELAIVNTLFTLCRAFLFAYGGIIAATKFHKVLLKSVIKARTIFYDVTPVGRILNRFSSDTYTVDDSLPFILNILLAQFFGLLGSIVITVYGLPWICVFLVPLIPIYHWLQNYYRKTSRELKRITSVTLSPVYSHFNESLQGLTTIHAMRQRQRFIRDNELKVDANLKAQFAGQVASRWLGLRLQFIGVAIVTGVSFMAVIQHQFDVADPGLIGLAISYALTITGTLSGVVNAFTETEKEMIAVERVNQYIESLPPESPYYSIDPPFGWPNQGVVAFNDVVLKYRRNLDPSLNGVSFETRSCEKIGVVGRTGAGKSSLISALFRMSEIDSGVITIDSVNTKQVSISSLRSRLFCIPQDPFLFSSTIRENLDPLQEFKDEEIWKALSKVNLEQTIKNLGGLTNTVDGSGINFSVGQKQLICLARAVLHNAKILCIDEATANIDQETDRQIQQTLRIAFKKSTVLTIAHRVQTILDSDRVLVMSEGKVLEFDSPDSLLSDPSSHFYNLVNQDPY